MPANMKKAGMNYMYGGSKKKMGYGGSKKHNLVMEEGGSLKPIPSDNKGLPKLPTSVRNNMGYMKHGGMKKMMGVPGMYQTGGDMVPNTPTDNSVAGMTPQTQMSDDMLDAKAYGPDGTPQSQMQDQDAVPPIRDMMGPSPDRMVPGMATNPKMVGIPGMYAGGSMTTDSAKNIMGMKKKGGNIKNYKY